MFRSWCEALTGAVSYLLGLEEWTEGEFGQWNEHERGVLWIYNHLSYVILFAMFSLLVLLFPVTYILDSLESYIPFSSWREICRMEEIAWKIYWGLWVSVLVGGGTLWFFFESYISWLGIDNPREEE